MTGDNPGNEVSVSGSSHRADTGGSCYTEGQRGDILKLIRPFNITILILAVAAGFFLGKIDSVAFFGFATGLAVWWFKARDDSKRNGGSPP